MKLGAPTLRVKDMNSQLKFYQQILGLNTCRRYTQQGLETCELVTSTDLTGSSEPLLILKHDPQAKDKPHGGAGLYHYALLVPDTASLASAYLSIKNAGVNFDGFADHLVSQSLYLHDNEGNGIEIYADRPKDQWQHDDKGHVMMDTLPLDMQSLLSGLDTYKGHAFPRGAIIGHIHLQVSNLQPSSNFYQGLGFAITSDWSQMGAMFLGAQGYHHHIGLNTWHSKNGSPHIQGNVGLELFTIVAEEKSMLDKISRQLKNHMQKNEYGQLLLSDPDGIQVLIKAES